MASSRRTYDTDTITLRTVFAKDSNNTPIPALRTLTSDGDGGTYWAIPSTLGIQPAFNRITTSAGVFTADLSFNTFNLLTGEGQGMYKLGSSLNLYSKAFTQIDVSGDNLIAAYSNNFLHNHLKIAGEGAISIRSDPATNTVFINGPASQFLSTPVFAFNQVKFIEGVSSITNETVNQFGSYITANSPSTLLSFGGAGDLRISTNVTTNTAIFSISTFTSKGYLDISANTYGLIGQISGFTALVGTAQSSISTFSSIINTTLYDNLNSSILALAISTGEEFYLLSGQINARATIIQLNDSVNTLNSNIGGAVSTFSTSIVTTSPRTLFSTINTGSTAASGSVKVSTPSALSYSGTNKYNVFVTLNDITPTPISVINDSPSTFTIYWSGGSANTKVFSWQTIGI